MIAENHGINTDKEIADIINNQLINITKDIGLKRSLIHISQPLKATIHVLKGDKPIKILKVGIELIIGE